MITIIVGTNRPNSFSATFADFYLSLLRKNNIPVQILDLNKLPSDFAFSALYDNSGKNNAFNEFQRVIEGSSKYIFIVPEYNGSFPGVLKTFIDGLAYPHTFSGKKCALVGISSGGQGGGLALSHLTDILNYMGMHVLALKPKLARIEENWAQNVLINSQYQKIIERQIKELLEF